LETIAVNSACQTKKEGNLVYAKLLKTRKAAPKPTWLCRTNVGKRSNCAIKNNVCL